MSPRSLSGRVALGVLAVVAVVLIVGGVVVATITVREDRQDFDDSLARVAGNLAPGASGALGIAPATGAGPPDGPGTSGAPPPPPVNGQPPFGGNSQAGARRALEDSFRQGAGGDVQFVRAVDADGSTVGVGRVPPGMPAIATSSGERTVDAGGAEWRLVARRAPTGVVVEVGADTAVLSDRASRLRQIVLVEVLVGLALAAVATLFVTRFALRPLVALGEKATGVKDTRDLAVRVSEPGQPTEVATLAGELDGMLERLGESAEEREAALQAARRFAADAGHELRTPLQSVRANLDIARSEGVPEDQLHVALDNASAQSDRLERLVDGLQSLARGEAGLAAAAQRVDLGDIADGAVAAARTRHPKLIIELDVPGDGPFVSGDNDGLWRVVENLIENAALHGKPDGCVLVETCEADGAVVLAVEDDGPGIPVEDRDRLMERFARGRDAQARGSGLGLAIVTAEARRHGGELSLGDSSLGGLRAEVRLPPLPSA